MRSFQLKRLHSEDCGSDGNKCESSMSCVVLMEARVLPEKLDDCIKLLVENRLKDTKVYDGCETCYGSVYKDHSMVFIWSQWASVEHWEKYFAWRQERGDFEELSSLFAENPRVVISEAFF